MSLTDDKLHKFIKGHFSDKEIVLYYLDKARAAGRHASVAIDTSNHTSLAAYTREMISNLEQVNRFLNKDSNTVDDKKKS